MQVVLGVEAREGPDVAQRLGERLGGGEVGQRGAERGVAAVGDLDREGTTVGEMTQQAVDDRELVGYPLEHRIGDHEVERAVRRPIDHVGHVEVGAWIEVVADGAVDHGRGLVDAEDLGGRPLCTQVLGEVSGAASEIDDRRRVGRDLRDQVEEGSRPVVGELQIACRIPDSHASTLGVRRCRCHGRLRSAQRGSARTNGLGSRRGADVGFPA